MKYFRYACFKDATEKICECEQDLSTFLKSYKTYGLHVNSDNSVHCLEWAPQAQQLYLTGDFSEFLYSESYIKQITFVDIFSRRLESYKPSVYKIRIWKMED